MSRQEVWGPFIASLQAFLKLTDWKIVVDETPSTEGTWAEIAVSDQRKVATIHLCPSFEDQPSTGQKHTLVHELLHCYFQPLCSAFEDVIRDLPIAARRIARRAHNRQMEIAVDQLASVISNVIPNTQVAAGVMPSCERIKRPGRRPRKGPARGTRARSSTDHADGGTGEVPLARRAELPPQRPKQAP